MSEGGISRPLASATVTGQELLTGGAERQRLIESYLPLVHRIARHFAGRGERVEDLVQVGSIGLINAVDRCDPERRELLTAYVTRTVEGEIRRHLRDRCAVVRIPRRLQAVGETSGPPLPLDDDDAAALESFDGFDERALSRAFLAAAARSLDGRERRVLLLRYFLDWNQDEVGRAVGISQVHVSRVLRRAIVKMRAGLDSDAA
jgi:RNA polymerase sigma-B factor